MTTRRIECRGAKHFPVADVADSTVRDSVWTAMGSWRRFIIAIDGVDGAGKSTLGRYLSWQLGMPLIETDQFLTPNAGKLDYDFAVLRRIIEARTRLDRPIVVEGVRILALLRDVNVGKDFHIWVQRVGEDGSFALRSEIDDYIREFAPRAHANLIYDAKRDDDWS